MNAAIRPHDRILFIGDSITDAERDRASASDLGAGYVAVVAAALAGRPESADVVVLNRGIGGNRAIDLAARWGTDCIAERPTLLSVLIGVNDTWRRFDEGRVTDIESFTSTVRHLLDSAVDAGIVRLVLIEPFTLEVGVVTPDWDDDLAAQIAAIRSLAAEYGAVLVPASELFAQWAQSHAPEDLLMDGVHPTPLGHELLAGAWIEAVQGGVARP